MIKVCLLLCVQQTTSSRLGGTSKEISDLLIVLAFIMRGCPFYTYCPSYQLFRSAVGEQKAHVYAKFVFGDH